MARSKSTTGSGISQPQSLASLLTFKLRPAPLLIPVPFTQPQQVLEYGDRRLFRPDRSVRAPHSVTRAAARVQATHPGARDGLRFSEPRLVALCVRRKQRREVLFAIRKTRKGAGSKKHRNFWSSISCR